MGPEKYSPYDVPTDVLVALDDEAGMESVIKFIEVYGMFVDWVSGSVGR